MFSFHEAPPPARPWSAIIREACASAPVSASSRQSRIGTRRFGQDRRPQCRQRAQVAGREQPTEIGHAGADELPRLPAGHDRRPRGAAVAAHEWAPRASLMSAAQRLLAARAATAWAAHQHCHDLGCAARRAGQVGLAAAPPAGRDVPPPLGRPCGVEHACPGGGDDVGVAGRRRGAGEEDRERVDVDPERPAAERRRLDRRDAGAAERVEHEVAGRSRLGDPLCHQIGWLARPVLCSR